MTSADEKLGEPATQEVQMLQARVAILEQMLDVYEQKALAQSAILERAIAERDRHTRALTKSNAQLEEFAYVASHDLQEPLRKILAFGERLRARCASSLDERGTDYLARMESASLRMQRLIADLLAYSRLSTKAQKYARVDLRKIVGEVTEDLEVRLEESNGTIEIGDLPELDADPLQMRQLFQNLLGNGLKFRRPEVPPHIHISSRSMGEGSPGASGAAMCEITLRDNGIGFDPKYGDQIFGIFQRLQGRDEYEGTGIGLSICRKIVESHNGSIEATGVPGEGATFVIRLAMVQDPGEAE